MSDSTVPTELQRILAAQQQQIAQLSTMISSLSEAVLAATNLSGKVHEHAVGQAAALQVFAEVLVSASPELARYTADTLGKLLAREDVMQNEHLRNAIKQIHDSATAPARGTPEGRRAGFRVVPDKPDDSSEP